MNKTELLQALSYSKECLSKQTFIPILSNFCFSNNQIKTFNGCQGVIVDFKNDFNCLVPGEIFYNIIKNTTNEDLNFTINTPGETNTNTKCLILKSGKSISKFSVQDSDSFIFNLPENYTSLKKANITEEFIKGLEKCLLTVNTNPIQESQFGITITKNAIYSTDGIRISKYSLSSPLNIEKSFVFPKIFCEFLYKFSTPDPSLTMLGEIFFGNDFIIADFGKVKLFTKLNIDVNILDFEKIIDTSYSKTDMVFPIPIELQNSIKRCNIFLLSEFDKIIEITSSEENISFEAISKYGTQKDSISIPNFPQIEPFKVNADFLSQLFTSTTEFTFYKKSLINEDSLIVVVGKQENYLQLLCSLALNT